MRDIAIVKSNIRKMVSQNAPEEDIDGYIASEGYTPEDVANYQISRPEALGRSALQGVTLGFGDELLGASQNLGNKFARGYEKLRYGDNLIPKTTYKEQRDIAREKLEQGRNQYPGQSLATEIGSSFVSAGPVLKGVGLVGSGIKNFAKQGAAFGGISSVGETEDVTNLPQVGKDVALGSTLGGAVGAAVPYGIGKVGSLSKQLLQKVTGIAPESEASIQSFKNVGVDPTLANITEGQTTKNLQNMVQNFPGGKQPLQDLAQKQVDQIYSNLTNVANSKGVTTEKAGRILREGATNVNEAINNKVTRLYDNLDNYIPSSSKSSVLNFVNKKLEINNPNLSLAAYHNADIPAAKMQETAKEAFEKGLIPDPSPSTLATKIDNEIQAGKIPTTNLQNILKDSYIENVAKIGDGQTQRVLNRIPEIVDPNTQTISYPQLKMFRSVVGAKLDSFSLQGDERAALKKIYGAMSEDMKEAVVKNGGEKALEAFNKANNFFNRSIQFKEDKIAPLLRMDTPQKIYKAALTKDGSTIRALMTGLDSNQKQFIRGTVLKRMGTASPGVQDETGQVFSPSQFLTKWNSWNHDNPQMIRNVFTTKQIESINNLNKVISKIKNTQNARQTSNNLPYMGMGVAIGVGAVKLLKALGFIGGARITSNMMTSPKFINWLAKAPRVSAANAPKHIKELGIIASQNPEIKDDIANYLQGFSSKNQDSEQNTQENNL